MGSYDVIIVGGGPAGSSCAWKLRHAGLKIAILDRQIFPRHKVCGGWITPAVLDELCIDPAEYAERHVLQPITGFRTSCIGRREVETHYGQPVSYGIRRFEFDDYLLRRSGAILLEGTSVTKLERAGCEWILNGRFRTRMLVGAGGTFCPVARLLGAGVSRESVVAAQEAEFEMDKRQLSHCSIHETVPELYFCSDLKGYGWCFRKGAVMNVGLGRLGGHGLSRHVTDFVEFLQATRKLALDRPPGFLGHAYLLFGERRRNCIGDGVLLIGDALGVAYAQSGEGIRPAIESGLLAAEVIAAAQGRYSQEQLDSYRSLLAERFGRSDTNISRHFPARLATAIGRRLLSTHWFARSVVLDRWFLRQHARALQSNGSDKKPAADAA